MLGGERVLILGEAMNSSKTFFPKAECPLQGLGSRAVSNWVAVKEPKLSYHDENM